MRNGLRALNVAIWTAEKEHNLDFLREALHDELVFRRPDGTVADDEFIALKASPEATAGFPQIYILAPDRHVIEINAEKLDTERASQRRRSLASTRASRTSQWSPLHDAR